MSPFRLVWAVRRWRRLARELVGLLSEVLRILLLLCCLTLALWFLLWLASSASEVVALLSLLFLLDRSRSRR